jgi:hypothetical protein
MCAGYGRVLPHETVKLLATFQPPIPGLQYFDLTCRTLAGRVFRLEGKCDGLQPEFTLSHNMIKASARRHFLVLPQQGSWHMQASSSVGMHVLVNWLGGLHCNDLHCIMQTRTQFFNNSPPPLAS